MGALDPTAAVEAEIESEARFVVQIAATMAAAEVASGGATGTQQFFEKADHLRITKLARWMLKEARRQARHDRDFVPVYDLDHLPADP